ncbi:carboxymuconolactone decarboxylase, partial [Xanthomonas hyacinthi DSM 19077]
ISASTAISDLDALRSALDNGLSHGLTISTCREVLVQLYAYAGFPRSLNALGELIKVLETRKAAGHDDAEGDAPGPPPSDYDALRVGTANQTKLIGAPAKGAVFDFAPAADRYVKAHVFGDIFSRDNLDWISREIATIGAL